MLLRLLLLLSIIDSIGVGFCRQRLRCEEIEQATSYPIFCDRKLFCLFDLNRCTSGNLASFVFMFFQSIIVPLTIFQMFWFGNLMTQFFSLEISQIKPRLFLSWHSIAGRELKGLLPISLKSWFTQNGLGAHSPKRIFPKSLTCTFPQNRLKNLSIIIMVNIHFGEWAPFSVKPV